MPQFKVAVDHGLERDTIVSKLQDFAVELRGNIPAQVSNIKEAWDDHGNLNFSFTAMGFKVSGDVVTGDSNVVVQGKIPFAALPFRGAIENAIQEQLKEAIATR